jgi:hypothetical protein
MCLPHGCPRLTGKGGAPTSGPGIPFHRSITHSLSRPGDVLTVRVSVITRKYLHKPFCPDLRLCSAMLCEFGTDRAQNIAALLRKKDDANGKCILCLSGEKSEECHAAKTSNPVC